MGDEQEGGAVGAVDLAHHLKHLVGGFGVQIAGGFIGEDEGGVHRQGAGEGDALLLAAGHVGGEVVGPGGEADLAEQVVRALAHGGVREAAIGEDGHHHVFQRREGGDEVVILEDEADGVAAEPGKGCVVQGAGFVAFDEEAALGRAIQQADDVEQGAFAGAGRADEGDEFAAFQSEVDLMQHLHLHRGAEIVGFADIFHLQNRRDCRISHGWPPRDLAARLARRGRRRCCCAE